MIIFLGFHLRLILESLLLNLKYYNKLEIYKSEQKYNKYFIHLINSYHTMYTLYNILLNIH